MAYITYIQTYTYFLCHFGNRYFLSKIVRKYVLLEIRIYIFIRYIFTVMSRNVQLFKIDYRMEMFVVSRRNPSL